MRLSEFVQPLKFFVLTVRVVLKHGTISARTQIAANSIQEAKAIAERIFGEGNILNINQLMAEDEEVTEATKTFSPQELQVKSLADKAEDYKQQAKAMKARQQMAKAQQNLMKAMKPPKSQL